MKAEKWTALSVNFCLSALISLGAVYSLQTAFALPLENPGFLPAVCLGAALLGAVAFRWRHGGTAVTFLLLFLGSYLWRRGIATEQLKGLIHRLSYIYDSAYSWGYLPLTEGPWNAGYADWPLGILGALLALLTAHRLCRRKSTWPILLCSLLPMGLCVVVTDTVPDALPLFSLAGGLILLLLTGAVRQESEAQGLRLTAMALIPVGIFLGGLYLLCPEESYVNRAEALRQELISAGEDWPALFDQYAGELLSGFAGSAVPQIDLTAVGPMDPSRFPVMEVTATQGGTLYLRGQDFDIYTGTGWNSSGSRQEEFSLSGEEAGLVTVRTRGTKNILYLPYYPRESLILSGGLAENEEFSLSGEETGLVAVRTRGTKNILYLPDYPRESLILSGGLAENEEGFREYTLSVADLPEDWRILTLTGESGPADLPETYLSLPEATRTGARQWLGEIPTGTNTAIAQQIARLVCSTAPYDLDTAPMPAGEGDFALWFLNHGDTGYCVHFATAATVLLRSAGVPARYVTGYMTDTKPGEPVTVTEEEAHAWAEYYEPILGLWIPLEATPASAEEEEAVPLQTLAPSEAAVPPQEPAAPKPSAPTAEAPGPAPLSPEETRSLTGLARGLILLAAAMSIAGIQRSARVRLRHRRRHSGSLNRQALARWQEAELLARLLGETPGEELLTLAQRAKFSQHSLRPEDLFVFDGYRRSCLRQLREKSWYFQLLYQYIYAIY